MSALQNYLHKLNLIDSTHKWMDLIDVFNGSYSSGADGERCFIAGLVLLEITRLLVRAVIISYDYLLKDFTIALGNEKPLPYFDDFEGRYDIRVVNTDPRTTANWQLLKMIDRQTEQVSERTLDRT